MWDAIKEIVPTLLNWKLVLLVAFLLFRKQINALVQWICSLRRGVVKVPGIPGAPQIDFETEESTAKPEATTATKDKPQESPKPEQPPQELKTEADAGLTKVFGLVVKDDNYKEAQELFQREVADKLSADERPVAHATLLRLSHAAGDTSAFEKLKELAEANNDKPRVIMELAFLCQMIGEFNDAKEQFLRAKNQYDANDAEQRQSIISCYHQAASCLASAGDYKAAIDMLRQLLAQEQFQDQKAHILGAMADIAKQNNVREDLVCYAEASLELEPLNSDLRFGLAYAYSEMKCNRLAMLHYKKLLKVTPHAAVALNNLAVSYSALGLKTRMIDAFRRSADQGETLAMANLAHNYLDGGFRHEAKELIDKANKLVSEGAKPHARIGNAFERLSDPQGEEKEREQSFLREAETERNFRVNYSKATLSDKRLTKHDLAGPWQTEWGELTLNLDETTNTFQAELHTKEEDHLASTLGARLVAPLGISQPQKVYKERNIIINGRISGLSGRYTIQIDDANKPPTLLTAGELYSATGYMVINENCSSIRIMEKTSEDKTTFKEWTKVV